MLVARVDDGTTTATPDEVIVEEPLEIRLDGHLVTTTMRTPGDDFELAAGLCFTDGLLAGAPVTGTIAYTVTQNGTQLASFLVNVNLGTTTAHGTYQPAPKPS